MNYEKLYKEALERARNIRFSDPNSATANVVCEEIFPELAESEEERMLKLFKEYLKDEIEAYCYDCRDKKDREKIKMFRYILDWLEKQSEQKPEWSEYDKIQLSEAIQMIEANGTWVRSEDAVKKVSNWLKSIKNRVGCEVNCTTTKDDNHIVDNNEKVESADKVEPRFKLGDWVVFNNKHESIYQIQMIKNGYYVLYHTLGGTLEVCVLHDEWLRLWTIADAKDGDILTDGKMVVIFKHFKEQSYFAGFIGIVAYVGLDKGGDIQIADDTWGLSIDKAKPATFEQRTLLFEKMKEAGYKWNAEKKELEKI